MAKKKKSQGKKKGSAFEQRLKKMKKIWEESKEESSAGGFEFPGPDGRYIAKLTAGELRESSNDNLMAAWQWTVMDGEFKGEIIPSRHMIETDQGFIFLQRDLRRLGVDVDDLEVTDIEKIVEEIVQKGPIARLQVKTKGDFQNVYINQVLDEDELDLDQDEEEESESEEEESESSEEEEEDEPEEEDSDSIEVGSQVITEEWGDEYPGTVKKINKKGEKRFHVEFEDGETAKYAEEDLTLVSDSSDEEGEEEEDEDTIEKGSNVAWNDGENTGVVKSISGKKAKVEDDDSGKTVTVKIDELELLVD